MELNICVVNTNIIKGENLANIVSILKDDYQCVRIDNKGLPLLLAVVHDNDLEDVERDIEDLNISNPAYEFLTRTVNNQTELDYLPIKIYNEPR